jgi:hypothetical protein
LSDLNGKSWGCALGGQTLFVEGFINHQRFAFSVSNPEQCPQSDSLPVKRLLEVLRLLACRQNFKGLGDHQWSGEPGACRTRESIAVDPWFEGDLAPTGELMGGSVCGDLYKGSVILIANGPPGAHEVAIASTGIAGIWI